MIWQRIIVFDENNYKVPFSLSSIVSLTDIIVSKNFSFERLEEIMFDIPKQLQAERYLDNLNSVLNLEYQYHIFRDY